MALKSRTPPGPLNTSRGAGEPAPASVAATAPMEGAHGGEPGGGFYAPEPEPAPASGLADAASDSAPAAVMRHVFTERVRSDGVALEHMGSADVEIVERAAAEENGDPEDIAEAIARIRAIRKPLGAYTQKLALPKRAGYHRHWFNDVAGRIEEAAANGWAHVRGTDGKPISRCVGSGRDKGALYAFAMEIPEVFWQEDQDAKNRMATERLESVKGNVARTPPGSGVNPADRGKFYDPTESDAPIQIKTI